MSSGMNTTGTSGSHDTDMHDMSNTNNANSTNNTNTGTGETAGVRQMGKAETNETPTTGATGASGRAANPADTQARATRAAYDEASDESGMSDMGDMGDEELEAVVIEVLSQESEGAEDELGAYPYDEERPAGFRWWIIPAIALPVAAGAATATVLILRQRRKNQMAAIMEQTRDWLDALRLRQAMNQAGGWWQQGTQWAQETAQRLPGRMNKLQRKAQKQLPPPATLRDRALDQFNTLRRQAPDLVSTWRDRALLTAQPMMDAARMRALAAREAALSRALATRDTAGQALNDATDRVNGTISHTLAFGLGALVAATGTYIALWRQRLAQVEEQEPTGANSRQMHEEPIL